MSQIINDRQSIAHSLHPAFQILWRIALTLVALVGVALLWDVGHWLASLETSSWWEGFYFVGFVLCMAGIVIMMIIVAFIWDLIQ